MPAADVLAVDMLKVAHTETEEDAGVLVAAEALHDVPAVGEVHGRRVCR